MIVLTDACVSHAESTDTYAAHARTSARRVSGLVFLKSAEENGIA